MVTDGNQSYCGDHFEMYRNIKSLCCTPATNVVLQIIYTSKANKQTQKKRSDLWLPEAGGGGRGNWMKVAKGTNISYRINKYQGCNVQHDKYN